MHPDVDNGWTTIMMHFQPYPSNDSLKRCSIKWVRCIPNSLSLMIICCPDVKLKKKNEGKVLRQLSICLFSTIVRTNLTFTRRDARQDTTLMVADSRIFSRRWTLLNPNLVDIKDFLNYFDNCKNYRCRVLSPVMSRE